MNPRHGDLHGRVVRLRRDLRQPCQGPLPEGGALGGAVHAPGGGGPLGAQRVPGGCGDARVVVCKHCEHSNLQWP